MLEKKLKLMVLKKFIELPENTGRHLNKIRKTIYKRRSLTRDRNHKNKKRTEEELESRRIQ